jgi:putative restriction endonuclease
MRYPLSIITSLSSPYNDLLSPDMTTILYHYYGNDPNHPHNVGLRSCMRLRLPLIYFRDVGDGWYYALFPAYVYDERPQLNLFSLVLSDNQDKILEDVALTDASESDIVRRYYTAQRLQRAHQDIFRHHVIQAYQCRCAFCRLKYEPLLEAAHIIPDSDPRGIPSVTNGISLCTLHHTAFDKMLIGVRPDKEPIIEVHPRVLHDEDGPTLIHALQGLHGQRMELPSRKAYYPDRDRLAERYRQFKEGV